MNYIYHCYGGSHSSVTAASIHLGLLDENRVPTKQELIKLPYYDQQIACDHGIIRFIGKDSDGNKIFISSKHNLGREYEKMVRSLACISGVKNNNLIMIDTMPYVNWLMVIGGYLSRRLGLITLGRPIVIWGTQISFFKFTQLVNINKIKYGRYYW